MHKCDVCRAHFRIFEVRREQQPKTKPGQSQVRLEDILSDFLQLQVQLVLHHGVYRRIVYSEKYDGVLSRME